MTVGASGSGAIDGGIVARTAKSEQPMRPPQPTELAAGARRPSIIADDALEEAPPAAADMGAVETRLTSLAASVELASAALFRPSGASAALAGCGDNRPRHSHDSCNSCNSWDRRLSLSSSLEPAATAAVRQGGASAASAGRGDCRDRLTSLVAGVEPPITPPIHKGGATSGEPTRARAESASASAGDAEGASAGAGANGD